MRIYAPALAAAVGVIAAVVAPESSPKPTPVPSATLFSLQNALDFLEVVLLLVTLVLVWWTARVARASWRSTAFHGLGESFNTYTKTVMEHPVAAGIVFGRKKAETGDEELAATMLAINILNSFDEWVVQQRIGAFPDEETWKPWRAAILDAFRRYEFLRDVFDRHSDTYTSYLGALRSEVKPLKPEP